MRMTYEQLISFWINQRHGFLQYVEPFVRSERYYEALRNVSQAAKAMMMAGLVEWRLGTKSPAPSFLEAGHIATQALQLLPQIRQPVFRTFVGYFRPVQYVQRFLSLKRADLAGLFEPPPDMLADPPWERTMELLDWYLLEGIDGALFAPQFDHLLESAAARPKLRLVAETFLNYRGILEAGQRNNADAVELAVRIGERHFARRRTDRAFRQALPTDGGETNNEETVDFRLALVLRACVQFGCTAAAQIQTIHQWRW